MRPLYPLFMLMLSLSVVAGSAAYAQQPDTLEGVLPEIQIEAARATETPASAPFAVSILARGPEALALEPGLSLDNVLRELPGVWIKDRGHFALGERILIRGMGWRAAFGVRGVQILLDGIPLTMPDGQAVADIADPALIRRAEVIRGPASLFWGNASGGVLFLSTARPEREPALRVRAMGGSYGLRQMLAESASPVGRHHVHAYASHVRQDGFRDYSAGRFTRAGLHADLDLGARSQLRVMAAVADQDAQNPGSLTAEQVAHDRQMADTDRYVPTRSGKQSTQVQLGTTLFHQAPFGLVSATAYGLTRQLDNPLPYAYVDVGRLAGGLRLVLQNPSEHLHWGVGLDENVMRDDRFNWDNAAGEPGTDLQLDQRETVENTALFGYLTWSFLERFSLSAGLRGDRMRFAMDDRLSGDGDQSGTRTFAAWSPSAGLTYRLAHALLFANVSTAFESPTTTELVNRPDTLGGFNPALDPQRTRGLEVGTRGYWTRGRLLFDVALFSMRVSDGIVPFQTQAGGARTFYRNVEAYTHDGVEVVLEWQALRSVALQLSYSGSRYKRSDGRWLPGIPSRRLYGSVQLSQGRLWSRLSAEAVSAYYVDDDNEHENAGYTVLDLNVGHRGLPLGSARLQPFFRIGNLLDQAYNASVIVNAFGNRYYEPAPGRTFQAGLNLAL